MSSCNVFFSVPSFFLYNSLLVTKKQEQEQKVRQDKKEQEKH